MDYEQKYKAALSKATIAANNGYVSKKFVDDIFQEDTAVNYMQVHGFLALAFMQFLDKQREADKMCLSNMECEDIDKAFDEMDFAKIGRYIRKYAIKDRMAADVTEYIENHFTISNDETLLNENGDELKTYDIDNIARHFYRLGMCDGYDDGRRAGEKCMAELMASPKKCNCGEPRKEPSE